MMISDKIQNTVANNIIIAQEAQQQSYAKRHPRSDTGFKIGDKVLLKNLKRDDRKGGWILKPWVGPYIINNIINNKLCVLKNGNKVLKTKQLLKNIKKFYESTSDENDENEGVKIISHQEPEIRYYNPVRKMWQLTKCRILKCSWKCSLELPNKRKLLNSPIIKTILGDGNCLFRALSYWVSGTEDNHTLLRKKVAEVIYTIYKVL